MWTNESCVIIWKANKAKWKFTFCHMTWITPWTYMMDIYIYTHTHTHTHIYIFIYVCVYNFYFKCFVCQRLFSITLNTIFTQLQFRNQVVHGSFDVQMVWDRIQQSVSYLPCLFTSLGARCSSAVNHPLMMWCVIRSIPGPISPTAI